MFGHKITGFLQHILRRRTATTSASLVSIGEAIRDLPSLGHAYFNGSSKPYVRWWWLRGPFIESDMAAQLDWLRDNEFGGVEMAWLAPSWLGQHTAPPKWLSGEWTRIVTLASRLARERGIGCDFTFGSCWPFGGSFVSETNACQTFTGPSGERLQRSWEDYDHTECRVVNHLSKRALTEYAKPLCAALKPALQPGITALFCDSLEVQTRRLWDSRLWEIFEERFGYRLEPFAEALDMHADVRYDYRKLISDTMSREFYAGFSEICHEVGQEFQR